MLKQLFRKLYLVFVVTIMAIVTGVIGFSFSNHVKASEAAQVTLLQRMKSSASWRKKERIPKKFFLLMRRICL